MSFDKNIWGNNIWYLFHTLAYQITETDFKQLKPELIYIVKTISSNLPCPECSSDATILLNKINFDNINSKEEFKLLLFNFHNHINKKLGKPVFEKSELDILYSKTYLNNIYNNFCIIFSSNSNNPSLMSSSFHRQQNLSKIKISILKIMSTLKIKPILKI
tara:strand:+ start:204 stop:686 length:483 start_codon:yes stop_codon:yes gene_type:complete